MADDTANIINTFLLEIPVAHKELLGKIRHWDNLKAAFESDTLWIKDINPEQVDSALIKGLPYSKVYYAKGGLLFLKDSLLPVKKMPQLLWSPLVYTIPVSLPSFNHNFFEIEQKIAVKIMPSQQEQPVCAVWLDQKTAAEYIQTAPKVRLNRLKWVDVDHNPLLVGTPLLPVAGRSYWRYNDFLVPTGFEFQLPLLTKVLKQRIDPDNKQLILWLENNTYITIEKEALMPLSISSFRLTYSER